MELKLETPKKPGLFQVENFFERFALVGAWLTIIIFFGILSPNSFLTSSNFSMILGSQAVIAVLTLGLIIPMVTGNYDLSIASVLTLSSMTVAVLNVQHGVPIGLAVLAALILGALVGLINGAFVIYFNIDPFIVTLGIGTILEGIILWMSGSTTISGISSSLIEIVAVKRFLGIPLGFYYGLVLCIFLWYFFEFTTIGRRYIIVGQNRRVAKLSGIKTNRIIWSSLIASGLVSAFAGVLYAGMSGGANPTSGLSFLLPAFAAAFLGSTSITPGRFNPWGAFIAVYFLITGITGLQILGIESYVQNLFYGGALVLAVALSQVVKKRQEKRLELKK